MDAEYLVLTQLMLMLFPRLSFHNILLFLLSPAPSFTIIINGHLDF